MARRAMAGAALLLVAILLIFAFRSCVASQKESALKEYVTGVTDVVKLSNSQSAALFESVFGAQGGTDQTVDIQQTLNAQAVGAGDVVEQAEQLDPPDEMKTAHDYLLEVLELRRDGLNGMKTDMAIALGDEDRREGTQRLNGWMRVLVTSDVLYEFRFYPTARAALRAEEIVDLPPRESAFVPDPRWLDPDTVSDEVNALRTGTGGGDGEAAPGLHGNGIAAVTLGGIALASGAPASVQLGGDVSFEIQVQNQGENTETDVQVNASVGSGRNAIELEGTIDTIAAGETITVTIPLEKQPPTGDSVPVRVEVVPVPGEGKVDNNTLETDVIFTR
jgi:hypothetical protein